MAPIRILHVVGAMNRGGAESMVMTLYRNIDHSKVQFDFLEFTEGSSAFSKEILDLGGRILKVDWSQTPTGTLTTLRKVVQMIKENGPYVAVHSHVLFASGLIMLAAKIAGVRKRIAHAHSTSARDKTMVARVYRLYSRLLIQIFSSNYVACSNDAGMYLFGPEHFGRAIDIIPNGVDTETFKTVSSQCRKITRTSLGVKKDTLLLLSVARLEPVKNHQFLVDLADELRANDCKFVLLLVGDGSLKENLMEEVRLKRLESNIKFLGVRSDISALMGASDIFLLPSLFEGLPVSLIEAQATGLPSIVSDNVTREADVGLELIRYINLHDLEKWREQIISFKKTPIPPEVILRSLSDRSFTAQGAVHRLSKVYDIDLV